MPAFLDAIISEKEREVQGLKKRADRHCNHFDLLPGRDFKKAISQSKRISLIAEIKFVSPSAGVIRDRIDPGPIGRLYEEAGARAISLITDNPFFGGDLQQLPLLKEAVSLPILRKDFILDEVQLWESRRFGADAVLLISRILPQEQLTVLLDLCRQLGMAALVEVHNRPDLEKALVCGAEIIGINNRDLDTFQVNLRTTFDLAPHIPPGIIKVSESGIKDKEDIRLLRKAGVQALLVGTTLMKSENQLEKTRELVEAG
ncbi:MAG: indole-3-glycerol phosphate synthase TrpC [Pseudomonadota bacterium]